MARLSTSVGISANAVIRLVDDPMMDRSVVAQIVVNANVALVHVKVTGQVPRVTKSVPSPTINAMILIVPQG